MLGNTSFYFVVVICSCTVNFIQMFTAWYLINRLLIWMFENLFTRMKANSSPTLKIEAIPNMTEIIKKIAQYMPTDNISKSFMLLGEKYNLSWDTRCLSCWWMRIKLVKKYGQVLEKYYFSQALKKNVEIQKIVFHAYI